MKRILKAIAITLSLPILLGVIAWLIVDVLGWDVPEWVVTILGYLFAWPLLLLGPLIPASDSPVPHAPLMRSVLYLVAVLLDVFVYTLIIYAVLYWREKRGVSRRLIGRAA
jgi:uncharacterized membrane protein